MNTASLSPAAPPQARWSLLVQAMAFCSGGLALAQQVFWTRRMIDLLGAAAGSATRVFSCFFLGLALGAVLGARLARRTRRPWGWIALAEAGVALLCLPMVLLPWWSAGLWPWLGAEVLGSWTGGLVKTLLSVLMVLPPSVMMGFFLPLAVAGWPETSPKMDVGLRLYVLNTFGALAGILLASLLLPGRLGILHAMLLVIGGNLLSAAMYAGMDRVPCFRRPEPKNLSPPRGGRPPAHLLWISGLSGALILSMEVVALLMLQWVAPLSFFAPGAILFSFIGVLALSSLLVERTCGRRSLPESTLVPIALVAGGLSLTVPPLFLFFAPAFGANAVLTLAVFWLRMMLLTLLVFGPALFFAGGWFPLAAHRAAEGAPDQGAGAWGWMLAVNGVGGLLGAELTLQVLLPWLGAYPTVAVIALGYLAAASWLLPPRASRGWTWGTGAAVLAALFLLAQIFPGLPVVNPGLHPFVVDTHHGREGSVVILDAPQMGRAILMQNQYILGSSGAAAKQERQAHLPLLLHPQPRQVGFIGSGTGISPGAALRHEAVERVQTAEISAAVVRASARWFAEENHHLATHPRSALSIEDGRTWVAARRGVFDVLISDLFLPWGPGEGRLYTVEHFQAARRSLKADGFFCLWLPMYQLTDAQARLIFRSFLAVFPEAMLVMRERQTDAPVLGLISAGASPQWIEARLAAEQGWRDSELETAARARELILGALRAEDFPGPVNTLDNLAIELDAGRVRALWGEEAPYLTQERFREFVASLPLRSLPADTED